MSRTIQNNTNNNKIGEGLAIGMAEERHPGPSKTIFKNNNQAWAGHDIASSNHNHNHNSHNDHNNIHTNNSDSDSNATTIGVGRHVAIGMAGERGATTTRWLKRTQKDSKGLTPCDAITRSAAAL